MPCSARQLTDRVRDLVLSQGWDLCGFTRLSSTPDWEKYQNWLKCDYHAGMEYMEKQADIRRDPTASFPLGRSVIVIGISYYQDEKESKLEMVDVKIGKAPRGEAHVQTERRHGTPGNHTCANIIRTQTEAADGWFSASRNRSWILVCEHGEWNNRSVARRLPAGTDDFRSRPHLDRKGWGVAGNLEAQGIAERMVREAELPGDPFQSVNRVYLKLREPVPYQFN